MSIVASVKVYDGIVLGAESMTQIYATVPGQGQHLIKSYENARKLFQIAALPIGVLTYGAGNIGNRSVESFLGEFSRDKANKIAPSDSIEKVAQELFEFMRVPYDAANSQTPLDARPVMGFCVCGYWDGPQHLGSEWEFQFPHAAKPQLMVPDQQLGASWRGVSLPFSRLFFGFDPRVDPILLDHGVTQEVINKVREVASQTLVTRVTFDGMPVQDAIRFCRFIIETTVGWARYETGWPSCGGPIHIAVITRSKGFEWVDEPKYSA